MSRNAKFNLSRLALDHPGLTGYLFLTLLLGGIAAYFQLGQDEDPPFAFRTMVVRAFWPGATSVQMAEQVSDKLEKTLQQVPAADRIRSYSKPGETTTLFQIKDSTRAAEIPEVWKTVRNKINDIRHTLPAGVQGPFFNDDFGDVYGVIYALESDGFSYAELKQHSDQIRQELLRVPDVAKVEIFGAQDEQIFIEISQMRLSQMQLNITSIIDEITRQNSVHFAGVVHTPSEGIQVRVTGQFISLDELREMPLRVNERNFRLGDLAKIERGYIDPPATKVHYQGKEVIALGVSMTKGGDIVRLGKALAQTVPRIRHELPIGIELHQVQDQPKAVSNSVQEFLRVLAEALIIVLVVSFLSLGLHSKPWRIDMRPGLVVALSIPSVLAVTFLVMEKSHIGLHKISLGSLIIALGLLVDDAILVVEMMVRKLEEGYDKVRAATFAYDATAMPMLTGTLITAAGFLPIGLAQSAVGEYTFAIFAVTGTALLLSWLVSVYFVPFLGYKLLHKPVIHPDHQAHELFDAPFYNLIRRSVTWCIEHRWFTLLVTLLALVMGIYGMTKVEKQFFPDSNRPELIVDLWLPEGSAYAATEALAQRVESRLQSLDGVETVTTFIGSGAPRFFLSMEQLFPQTNLAQLILIPRDLATRDRLRRQLPALLADEFPEVRGRAKLLPNGPPVAYPVQFRILGPDIATVRQIADQVKEKVRANTFMRGVNDNWNESVKVLRLDVDQARARALGVSARSIATAAHALLSGATIGQYRENNSLIDITLRQPASERDTLTALTSAYVPTSSGRSVLISQVARVELVWEPGVVWRENRDFAITVQGDVADGIQGTTVALQIDPTLQDLREQLPPGYRILIAGTVEESNRGTGSISTNVPLMLFIMFTLLMLQLKSFSRSLLVFLTGPLGIIGASATLLILDRPFGFVAMLGVIALNGMIIRNSVILIDQIEQDISRGAAPWHAIIEAAVGRCRPIILTAAAAVLSMIPLSHSVFWGPMAVAIMGGLTAATFLTLFSLPAMYAAWFRVRRPEVVVAV